MDKELMKTLVGVADDDKDGSDKANSKPSTPAIDMMTTVVAEQLSTIPGFDILESYKDRVCDSLPADYNTTAVRLQSLIGASDHMVQWVLTGDMSLVNQRIYQIVLAYVWCQPHFIKFCDIMEVLAEDSITVGHIKALRKDLLRQLYGDGHITSEQLSHLESNKLFESSATSATPPSVVCDCSMVSGNISSLGVSVSSTAKGDVMNLTKLQNVPKCHVEVGSTCDEPLVSAFGATASEHNSMNTDTNRNVSLARPDQTVGTITYEHDVELPPSVTPPPADSNVPEKIPNDDLQDNEASGIPVASDVIIPKEEDEKSDVQNVDKSPTQLSLPIAYLVEGSSKDHEDSIASVSDHDNSSSPVLQEHNEEPPSATLSKAVLPATATAKPLLHTSGERPQITTLNSHSTESDVADSLHTVLPLSTGDQFAEINQWIDLIVDSEILSYSKLAFLCLMPKQERIELFTRSLANHSKSQDEEVHSKVVAGTDTTAKRVSTDLPAPEICEHLESTGLALLKEKYSEILECFPENYEATLGSVQNLLSDMQICDILSLTTGHNQKILDCLIEQLKGKEDLLDFCANLEKIPEPPTLLQTIVEQLRKEVIKALQSTPSPHKPVEPPKEQKTTSSEKDTRKDSHKDVPPKMTLPDHPALLVIPKPDNLFDAWQMDPDSEVLAALKKCYSIMIDKLPSNHLTTLLRLQDLAVLPGKVVDSIADSPSAQVGNKMIVDYLIGLVHTEDHIIIFCAFAERMLREFENCICILNLRNSILMSCKLNTSDILGAPEEDTATPVNEKKKGLLDSALQRKEGVPNITSIRKCYRSQDYCQPYLHDGIMAGYKQCLTINSNGGKYDDTIKAVAMETESVADEGTNLTGSTVGNGLEQIISFFQKDVNKEVAFNLRDSPNDQRPKQYYVDCIELLFKECTTSGGQWVVESAKLLDKMGIGACGHQAREKGIILKVFASCQRDQKATVDHYVTKKGIYYNNDDDSIWLYYNKKLSDTQTTCGCDFTKIKCLQLDGPKAPCRLSDIPSRCSWNWEELIVTDNDNIPASLIFTVRGKDRGQKAWHLVLVERKLLDSFHEKVATGNIDVAKFGYVIKSGWGKDPPDDVLKNVELYGPNRY